MEDTPTHWQLPKSECPSIWMKILEDEIKYSNFSIWCTYLDWNFIRIIPFEIDVSSCLNCMTTNLRSTRLTIFEWRPLSTTFIRFLSSWSPFWGFVDHELTEWKAFHDPQNFSFIWSRSYLMISSCSIVVIFWRDNSLKQKRDTFFFSIEK